MTKRLDKSLKKFSKKKEERLVTISGELGLPLGGQKLVEVPNRKGFVYVRLKNNTSEVIQAYNSEVSTIYGLAVLVARQNNIYKVIGRDLDRYRDWSDIPYLPKHGGQHSFNQALGMGADITWIYSQQLMPLLGYPSGSNGSNGIIVAPHLIRDLSGNWKYVGNTGTPDISMYRPSIATGAVMVLVYIDTVSGNPYLLVGSGTTFHAGITGTSDLAKHIPQVTNPNWMPNTAVRLTSGTTQLTWANLYDARPFLQVVPTGTSGGSVGGGGGIGFVAWDEGVFLGTGTVLNFVGDNVDASISGSVVRVFVTGSSGGGINTGTLDARYLKLDASNDPVTGLLTIIPSAIDTPGLEIETMGDASSFQVTQRATGTSSVLSPVFSLVREPSGNSVVSFFDPIFLVTQSRGTSGTATGPLLSYLSEATERVNINPNAQGTGTLAFIDGDFTLSPDGLLLLLKNHGTSRFYVNASGTAYSNNVPLIKEAPADGTLYARKNSGWETVSEQNGGWTPAPSLTFLSADSPSFVVYASQNATGTFGTGMKIQLTHQSLTKNFFITQVSLTGTTTYLNLYGGTDFTLNVTGTITNSKYSSAKAPFGFPISPTKWSVIVTDTTQRQQSSPVAGTWYNPGSISISAPIGLWRVYTNVFAYGEINAATNGTDVSIALSTSNNSVSNTEFVRKGQVYNGDIVISLPLNLANESMDMASKTTWYIITKTDVTNANKLLLLNSQSTLYIKLECAYL